MGDVTLSRIAPRGRARGAALLAVLAALGLMLAGCTGTPEPTAPPSSVAPSAAPTPSPTAALPRLPAGITQRAVIGDPWSTSPAKVHAVAKSALAIVKSARKGQTLTLSMFNLTYPGTAQILIAASRRGVAVRVLLNSEGASTTQAKLLRSWLGDTVSRRSWVVVRPGGIRMHSKFLLLTPRAGKGPTVWVSSGNLTESNGRDQANEALITTGDQKLYTFLMAQFTLMRKGVTSPKKLGRVATTASALVRTFPLPEGGAANDPVLALLNDITCTNGTRHTTVRMGQLFLTIERIHLVAKLRELAAAGCRMQILGHMRGWNPDAITGLLAKGAGHVDLRSTTGRILHTKITTVDGWNAAGARIKVAMVGSHNLTGRALSRTPEGVNDELSLRIWNPPTVDAYSAWIDRVIARHSTPAQVP